MRTLFTLALVAMITGCAYKAEPVSAPAFNVVTSYGDRVPGKWLLYVDAAALDRPVKPSGVACSAHDFPLALSGAFATSVRQTLANVVEDVEVVSGPMPPSQINAYGARGLILSVLRGRGRFLEPELRPNSGI